MPRAEPAALVIAVDGPAAAGKGTLARRLAARYGLRHLDTGLLYRAAALRLLRANGDPAQAAEAAVAAGGITDADLEDPALRAEDVGQAASVVAAMAPFATLCSGFNAPTPPGRPAPSSTGATSARSSAPARRRSSTWRRPPRCAPGAAFVSCGRAASRV